MKFYIECYVSWYFLKKLFGLEIQNTVLEKFKTQFLVPKLIFFLKKYQIRNQRKKLHLVMYSNLFILKRIFLKTWSAKYCVTWTSRSPWIITIVNCNRLKISSIGRNNFLIKSFCDRLVSEQFCGNVTLYLSL
jgi:hypothetical protein